MTIETFTINGEEYQSYVTVEEADTYFSLDSDHPFLALANNEKQVLLVAATRRIDLLHFKGSKQDADQFLKWPRSPYGFPYDIELATILWANILRTDSTQENVAAANANISRIRAGSVEVYFFKATDIELLGEELTIADPTIRSLLAPYLAADDVQSDSTAGIGGAFGTSGRSIFTTPNRYERYWF